MRPSLLNPIVGSIDDSKTLYVNGVIPGEVAQKEDYGYTINLGYSSMHGFLKCNPAEVDCMMMNDDE